MSEPVKIYVRLKGIIATKFFQVKRHLGLENDTEVVRALIGWYYREHEKDLPLTMEHFNLYDDHITIRDHRIGRYVDIYARNGDLWCEHCESKDCEHIRFAVEVPEVENAIQKRGWQYKERE